MPYRILSLDGGGTWALVEVRALIGLYEAGMRGHDLLQEFDMVAATSGGSLVLAGLVENKTLGEILEMFRDEHQRRSIFSPTHSLFDKGLEWLVGVGPKYSEADKLPAIEKLLPGTGNLSLQGIARGIGGPGGQAVHLLIVAFDYDLNRAVFFRSAATGVPEWGDGAPASVTLAGAVHASTNAPVLYFDAPAGLPLSPDRYWDGAVTGCNNPVLAAVTEAITLGKDPRDLRVLSLGSATVRLPLAPSDAPPSPLLQPRQASGVKADVLKMATAILDDPPDAATFIAHAVTGGGIGLPEPLVSRIVRMNPVIRPVRDAGGEWAPPKGWTQAQFASLCSIGMDAVDQIDVDYIDSYVATWMAGDAPNQPIRADGATFEAEIGYETYETAKAAWPNPRATV